ncbi:MAG TPA: OsmC family protein [Bacteroidia bacterium]|nr:OsmC family protein [Bacteroidia bacterium]
MAKEHFYNLTIQWTGNKGAGTKDYRAYDRNYRISAQGRDELLASADPAFLGDKTKYNPEEFLLAAISSCHMLWFLHLCADAGVIITDYIDSATGTMVESGEGGGRFKEVILNPVVVVSEAAMISKLDEMHNLAHKKCFISNSVNFPVLCNGNYQIKE